AFVSVRALEVPGTLAIAELRDLTVEARAFEHTEVPRDTLEVGANVLAFGHQRVPFRVAGEGVGVPVCRHVAGKAGICILSPGAADAVAFLEDIAFDAAVLQLDRSQDTGHTRTDHRHAQRWTSA